MATEEERVQEIKESVFEYIKQNDLSAYATSYYLVKQIVPKENMFFKMNVIDDLKEAGIMRIKGDRWIIQ